MSTKAGEYLRHDPIKLRFTTTHASDGSPKAILEQSLNQSIAEIMTPSYINPTRTVILYEKLHVSIVELETKRGEETTSPSLDAALSAPALEGH
jgi:ubiquitin carboxyl-terminal hydrolase 7